MSTSTSSRSGAGGAQIGNSNSNSNGRRISTSPPPPSLEQKLEMLESRFTQPLGAFGNTSSNNNATSFSSPQERGRKLNNASMNENSNLSEHSFGFSGSNSNHSNQPTMTIRSKKNNRSTASLDAVHRAAAKHMRKIAANSPVTDAGFGLQGVTSNFSFSSNSASSSNSQQTVVTGNRTGGSGSRLQGPQQPQEELEQPLSQPPNHERVVAESPPVLISPAKTASSTKPKVARALQVGNTKDDRQQQPGSTGGSAKRKSVPKRKVSSIQDTLVQSPIKSIAATASTTATGNSRSPRPASHHSNTFLSEHSRDRSNSNHASSNKKPRVLLPPANNKRIHDFFSASKKKPQNPPKAANTGNSNNDSNNKANSDDRTLNNDHGRNNDGINQSIGPAKKAKGSSTVGSTTSRTTNLASVASSATLLAAKAATEEWQRKCAKLQQQLQDKDEQLKAVTGNKTILHTALQQALGKTRKELQDLRESTADKTKKVNSVLEETLRWKFEKQAKELRATLSADGNRLGRIVSTRAGMRVIDTWEEGYASRDWQVRKEEWKSKHKALLEKQDRLKLRLNAQQENHEQGTKANDANQNDSSPDSESSDLPNDSIAKLSPLEIQEAQESIQMHMEALLREEKELLAEEQTLNDEKAAHIRALKRVASEDASRFRSRTKLHDRYVLDCLLGKGGFSEVWKGYDLKELREVAVKIHQLDPRWPDSKKENYTKHVSREYEIHRNVRHSRIVSLYDVFEIDNNSFATVLECCKGTDLDTLLKRKKRLPERQARAILLQILTGMQYLSQPSGTRQGIIHYDLKPGNILFDEFGDAKITDFGLSKIVDTPDPAESMELTSQGAGTYWYLPPECFVTGEQVRISNKVDVWSIGVIFYQMLYGQRPFGEGKSQDKLLADHTMLNAQEVHLPEKPGISRAGKDFVKQCLTYDQAFRPTIAQLCENPYVLQKAP